MATKLGRVVTYDEENSPIMLRDSLISKSHTKNKISPLSHFTTPVTTNLSRTMTCNEGNSPIMSQDPPTMWSHEVTWQIKKISLLLQGLCPSNLAGWWLMIKETMYEVAWPSDHMVTWQIENKRSLLLRVWPPNLAAWWRIMKRNHSWSRMTLWSRGHMWSFDKLKT